MPSSSTLWQKKGEKKRKERKRKMSKERKTRSARFARSHFRPIAIFKHFHESDCILRLCLINYFSTHVAIWYSACYIIARNQATGPKNEITVGR